MGHHHLLAPPDARDDEPLPYRLRKHCHALAFDGGIGYYILPHEGAVVGSAIAQLQVVVAYAEAAQQGYDNDYPEHTHRIGDGCGKGGTVGKRVGVLHHLLCGSEGRRVGGCATHHTHHVGDGFAETSRQHHCQQRAGEHYCQAPRIEGHTLLAQRTEEVGAYVQPESIDEEHQTEGLAVVEHIAVDRKPYASGNDTHEKDKCYA